MTLAELARLLDVDPKWVLNALTTLGRPTRYSIVLARRLAVALAIQKVTGAPLAIAFAQAGQALRSYRGDKVPVVVPTEGDVGLQVDIRRILSSFNIRLSVIRTTFAPRQLGRPPLRRRDPLVAATEWGIDLTLLTDNLGKTVEQRIRQLDAMAAFARDVHRSQAGVG
jgi:hypothetical protein